MQKKLLCISTVWPEANATAAGTRLLGVLEFFKSDGYQIYIAATSTDEKLRTAIQELDFTTERILLNSSSFDHYVRNLSPEIVLFDRFISEEQFGWRVRELIPNALRILDTEDLHSLRSARENASKNESDFNLSSWMNLELSKRELASIFRSDLSLIVSSFEYEQLITNFTVPSFLLYLLPITYEHITKEVQEVQASFEQRSGYVFIGNGFHKPNIDAIKWLYESIWPEILKTLPQATVEIYGAYLPKQILQLHHPKKGFYIKGQIPKVANAMEKARVNFAPLRFGAGIKGKILEGFRHGVPNITTPIGAEGMQYNEFWPGLITQEASAFAQKAIQLYQDKNLWEEKRQLGYTYINNFFSKELHRNTFLETIKILLATLENHRTKNFIGNMLSQQAFQASKFLSLWITEKNKNH
ncbi:MAG: glycosyltransferase [Flavobacteriaceae bacterium]